MGCVAFSCKSLIQYAGSLFHSQTAYAASIQGTQAVKRKERVHGPRTLKNHLTFTVIVVAALLPAASNAMHLRV